MIPRNSASNGGLTVIELAIGLGLLVMVMGSLFGWLTIGSRVTAYGISRARATEDSRWGWQQIAGSLMETSIDHVDTTQRVVGSTAVADSASDRFFYRGTGHVQCSAADCRFHTRPTLEQVPERLLCGFEYAELPLPGSAVRGKIWPEAVATCPLDGSQTQETVALDGLKFFSLRGRTTDIPALNADATGPRWTAVTLIFPCPAEDGSLALRRYDIHLEDLMAGAATWSGDWVRFDPDDPTMVELFDFGTDGTTDGAPDGRVPVLAALSDADVEIFEVQGSGPDATVVVSKSLDVTGNLISRNLFLSVRLRDGFTQFSVDHDEADGSTWSASNTFTCQQALLVSHLSEFAVSTAGSNPHDPVANPQGVRLTDTVRITVGVTRSHRQQERTEWIHEVSTLEVKCRN